MNQKGQTELEGVDKGWSWVIAVACFFGCFVLAGIYRTSGVLFVSFINTFGVNREEASWPVVVCAAVLNLIGPFAGILAQRFGIRPVVITGALIATIGISSCYFTTSLKVITVLFGGVFGVGYGFITTLMPVIMNSYFLNLRSTASGFANSGACIGSIILPILFEHLITVYGLSGCFLLTGGIVLHLTIAGALMRPPPWMHCKMNKNDEKDVQVKYAYLPCKQATDLVSSEVESKRTLRNRIYPEITTKENVKDKNSTDVCNGLESIEKESLIDEDQRTPTIRPVSTELQCMKTKAVNSTHCDLNSPKVPPTKEHTTSIFTSAVIAPLAFVFTTPMFYVISVTNVCFFFLYNMYVVIIVDYALDRHVLATDTKNILFAFSVSDLFGRLCLGWITDRKFFQRSRFVMLCMFLIGIVFCIFPHASDYASLIVVSCLYGLLLGCSMILFPVLLVDFCGMEHLAVASGCMCFMSGIASFVRPYLIGYFRDSIGSYSSIFYILGGLSVASSALWLLETCVKKRNAQLDLAV